MRKKWIVPGILAAVVVVEVIVLAVAFWNSREEAMPEQSSQPHGTSVETTALATTTSPQTGGAVSDATEKSGPDDPSVTTTPPDPPSTTGGIRPSDPVVSLPTQPPATQPSREIVFPYSIPGTKLVIQMVSAYEGIFLEDGSDAQVSNVAALLLKNTGDTDIEYASITLTQDSGDFRFEASVLPAGASILIQEKSQKACPDGGFTNCEADVAELADYSQSMQYVEVLEKDDGSLLVKNLTDQKIPCVRMFYKFYMADENTYVGGITYNAKLVALAAGESRKVTPSHYAAGFSRVVMVRIYDSEN